MSPAEPPTTGELSRRIDDLRGEVRDMGRGLHERLDKVPTNELLLAYLAKTDGEVQSVKEDVAEIKAEFAGFKKRIEEARRWGIGAAVSVAGLALAAITTIRSFAG